MSNDAGSGTVVGLAPNCVAHSNEPWATVFADRPRIVLVCAVVSNGTPVFTVKGAAALSVTPRPLPNTGSV